MVQEANFMSHGLAGSLEEAEWPPLTLAEVSRLLTHYPQGAASAILSYSPRPFSAASVVETRGGKIFVKRHSRLVRDKAGLVEEHRFISHLAGALVHSRGRCGMPALVQAPVATNQGETAIEDGPWTYEVHPVAAGDDVYQDALSWTPFFDVGDAAAAGRAMARLHLAAEGYDAGARSTRQLVSSFTIFAGELIGSSETEERLEAYLVARPLLRAYAEKRFWRMAFEELLLPWFDELKPWLRYLRPLWTHNDFHASNLSWSGRRCAVAGIFDFGLADRTTAVYDLAAAIERNCIEWLRIGEPGVRLVHFEQMDALLDGYEELVPLSYEEARALAAMLPLVHCEFALSEADYFLSILHSEKKAYLAYEGYFLGHAAWFREAEGQRLLEHLKHRAEAKQIAAVGGR